MCNVLGNPEENFIRPRKMSEGLSALFWPKSSELMLIQIATWNYYFCDCVSISYDWPNWGAERLTFEGIKPKRLPNSVNIYLKITKLLQGAFGLGRTSPSLKFKINHTLVVFT